DAARGVNAAGYYQPTPTLAQPPAGGGGRAMQPEPLPDGGSHHDPSTGALSMQSYPMGDEMMGDCDNGWDDGASCNDGYCSRCGNYGSSCCCLCPPGVNLCGGSRGQFFVTADYL